jgi:hypothetical protein
MMGDGVIETPKIRAGIEAAGFAGYSEVEIFSSLDWWKRPADDAAHLHRTASQRGLICRRIVCAAAGVGQPTPRMSPDPYSDAPTQPLPERAPSAARARR